MSINLGPYAKFITAAAGLAVTVLTQKYGGTTWLPYVVAAAAALGVYGVPNTQPPLGTEVIGELKSLVTPDPSHLHIHLDTGQPAPIVTRTPPQSYGGSAGSGGVSGGGAGGGVPGGQVVVAGGPVSPQGGTGGVGSVSTAQPPEFFESNTPASQPGSTTDAAGSAPVG